MLKFCCSFADLFTVTTVHHRKKAWSRGAPQRELVSLCFQKGSHRFDLKWKGVRKIKYKGENTPCVLTAHFLFLKPICSLHRLSPLQLKCTQQKLCLTAGLHGRLNFTEQNHCCWQLSPRSNATKVPELWIWMICNCSYQLGPVIAKWYNALQFTSIVVAITQPPLVIDNMVSALHSVDSTLGMLGLWLQWSLPLSSETYCGR